MKKGDVKKRFFVAVMPPAQKTEPLAGLEDKGPQDWEWKRAEDFHISLAFPGLLNENRLAELIKTLESIEHDSFDMHFEGVGYFMGDPYDRRANRNIIWARPDKNGDNEMRILHHKIVNKMQAAGFKIGKRDITPHLTLTKSPVGEIDLMADFSRAASGVKTESWNCDRFVICETLDRNDPDHPAQNNGSGTRYKVVKEFRLG